MCYRYHFRRSNPTQLVLFTACMWGRLDCETYENNATLGSAASVLSHVFFKNTANGRKSEELVNGHIQFISYGQWCESLFFVTILRKTKDPNGWRQRYADINHVRKTRGKETIIYVTSHFFCPPVMSERKQHPKRETHAKSPHLCNKTYFTDTKSKINEHIDQQCYCIVHGSNSDRTKPPTMSCFGSWTAAPWRPFSRPELQKT